MTANTMPKDGAAVVPKSHGQVAEVPSNRSQRLEPLHSENNIEPVQSQRVTIDGELLAVNVHRSRRTDAQTLDVLAVGDLHGEPRLVFHGKAEAPRDLVVDECVGRAGVHQSSELDAADPHAK